jgi:formate hydrogenlyase subunit 3/multisubunit Na+/H+ antiporter MnhD subunit
MGLAAFDSGGLRGAALTLTCMALTRPVMLLGAASTATTPARAARWLAVVGAAGLPPTIGFGARLLVLGAAVGLQPGLMAAALAGMMLELVAVARLAMGPMGTDEAGSLRPRRRKAYAALALGLLSVTAGVAPGLFLSGLWSLG